MRTPRGCRVKIQSGQSGARHCKIFQKGCIFDAPVVLGGFYFNSLTQNSNPAGCPIFPAPPPFLGTGRPGRIPHLEPSTLHKSIHRLFGSTKREEVICLRFGRGLHLCPFNNSSESSSFPSAHDVIVPARGKAIVPTDCCLPQGREECFRRVSIFGCSDTAAARMKAGWNQDGEEKIPTKKYAFFLNSIDRK